MQNQLTEPIYETASTGNHLHFRLAWEHSTEGMRLTDHEGTIVLVNAAYCRMIGKSQRDLLGQPLSAVYAAADQEALLAEYQDRVRRGDIRSHFTGQFRLWNGRCLWLEVSATPLQVDGQRPLILSIHRDISDRRRAEEQLLVQSAALESAANAIVITDREGTIHWVNPAFTRLTGYSASESAGRNPRFLKSGRQSPEFYRQMWQTITAGHVWQGEIINRRKQGTLYTEEATITPVQNREGEITHFIAIKMDVTSRREMEAELDHSRERFERIFQSSPAAIGICTLNNERFLDVNENFLRLLGYARTEVIGISAGTLGIWGDPRQHARLRDQLRQQGAAANYELRLRTKTDHELDALVSVEQIQLGADRCYVFIILDITAHKRLEEQLRQAQKMESLGTLAGGVAHDFNNLLTILHGHASLALTTGDLPERTVESLRQITQAAERASNLTRQLLTFSRKQPIQLRRLNLNEVVGNLTKMLRRIIGEDITLQFRYSPQIPSILADVGMLDQILLNLAVNARDAMPAGGSLGISTEPAHLDSSQAQRHPEARPGTFVCLTVQDSGQGIDRALLPRIFEPFFTTKDVGKGTGLGLATVHGIVQQHGGWIEVSSQPDTGTRFQIFLPASPRKKPAEFDTELSPKVRGGQETILLVEDEPGVQVLARQILEHYGYAVLTAASGQEALQVFKQHAPNIALLLTDVVMPGGLTGRQLANRLREIQPQLRVVYTSGYSPEVAGQNADNPHQTRFLAKPYPPADLAQAVRECLDEVQTA